MANVLVVAEFAEGKVKRTTHSAVTFARTAAAALGGSYSILVLGSELGAAAEELAKLGAEKVLVVDDASLANYLAERYAPTVAAVAKDYAVVVAAASGFGKDLLPRVAGRVEAGYAADITDVTASGGTLHYKRPLFAGNAFGICVVESAIQVVTVRQSAFAAAESTGSASPIEKVALAAVGQAAGRVEWVKCDQVKSERPELAEARTFVSQN